MGKTLSERMRRSSIWCSIWRRGDFVGECCRIGTDGFFSRYFIDDDYLSVIAFDIRVSIATARRPFPTRRLHYSSMAEKVRCIVSDVFANDERVKIAREAIWVQRVMGPFIRARRPVLFVLINDRVALQALLIGLGLLFGAVVALAALFGESWALKENLNDVLLGMAVAQAVVSGMFFWTVFTFVAHSMIDHDTVVSGELTGADRVNWERIAIGVGGILLGPAGLYCIRKCGPCDRRSNVCFPRRY